jgi:hypothetical protein
MGTTPKAISRPNTPEPKKMRPRMMRAATGKYRTMAD